MIDVVVNCVNAPPQLIHNKATNDVVKNRSWIKIRTVGTKSNRAGIGARIKVTAMTNTLNTAAANYKPGPLVQKDDVRSGGSYYSQNDLRVHFGVGEAKKVDEVEIRWPSGHIDTLKNLDVNRLYVIEEGGKIIKSDDFKKKA